MTKHYDVAIAGVWSGCNYGSIATYYALHEIVKSLGKTVLMIDKPYLSDSDPEIKMNHSRRFANEHYDISKSYRLEDFRELNEFCDSFIVGSDQLWNYGISKNFGYTFYLDYVKDEKKKIAFATSFGHGIDFAPPEKRKSIANYMKRFDGISLREEEGVKICREDYGINAVRCLDPVFVVDPVVYNDLAHKSKRNEKSPFLLTYILDPTPEKREAILHVSKQLGNIKIINMLDGLPWLFEKNKRLLNLPNCIEDLQIEDWLYYFEKARFVITDSCHGASFAMINHKDFIAIANKARGYSRFKNLGQLFHVNDHIVTNPEDILQRSELLMPIDYSKVDQIVQQEKKCSLDWLKNVLLGKKKTKSELITQNVIGTVIPRTGGNTVTSAMNTDQCVGCGACVSTCPVDAIKLQPDQWGYYRSCVDYTKCISCSKCVGVCPALKLPENTNTSQPDCYEYVSNDTEVLNNSSSGGVFYALANDVLEKNGVVVGAAWRDDLTVAHRMIDQKKDLAQLQKSKYLQSWMGDGIHRQVKKMLEEKRYVLFSGCPCQIAGLKAYLGKPYDRLITVDLLCGNSPSAGFFQKYLESTFPEGVSEYQFRYKKLPEYSWSSKIIEAVKSDGSRILHIGERDDDYQRVYHSHVMCAPHCEKCRYQAFPRQGDISIGDFWGISRLDPEINAKPGVSIVLLNSNKGAAFFEKATEQRYRIRKQVPLAWMGGNGYSRKGGRNWISPKRDLFYDVIKDMPFREAVDYTLKPNHGISRTIYKDTQTPMLYDYKMHHFRFEANIWEELFIENKLTLIVKENKWKENGHYARLPLASPLKKRKYRLSVKFRIRSLSDTINFHMIDSGSKILQIVHRENIKDRNDGRKWIEFSEVFVPDTDYFDEFMIGAAQVSGIGNYISFAYINIKEEQ